MNETNSKTNVGATGETGAVINQVKRSVGRPRNPDITRRIRLNPDNTVCGKGAPAVGKIARFAITQRSVKPSEFVFGVTPTVEIIEEVVKPRLYKSKPAVSIIQPQEKAIETTTQAENSAINENPAHVSEQLKQLA